MSIKNKLQRLKPHLTSGTSSEKRLPETKSQAEIPFMNVWTNENVAPYWVDDNYCLIREVRYPLEYKHGNYAFRDFLGAVSEWNNTNNAHPLSAKGHQAEDLFFFDTETTGLGGGTGNTIFILGYARVQGDEIVLKQHILPNPGSEVPLFKSFLENVDYTTLVTYNGKAFDWPQVKTRHVFVREHVPKLPEFGHFDLYHAARRMWKHRLERAKLSIVEQDVLGVERQDDIPGFLAPMIYFDFVERKNPEGMLGILKHNEIDILSLITLYTHLSFQLLQKDESMSARETYEVGRWYASLGESTQAVESLKTIMDGNEEENLLAQFVLAKQYKKDKNDDAAQTLWENIIKAEGKIDEKVVYESYIEAAKLYEHKLKEYKKALEYTTRAHKLIEGTKIAENTRIMTDVYKRKNRLCKKMGILA
ncbi:ribonuclease H-like domain-containing protein [Paenibacillus alvei]